MIVAVWMERRGAAVFRTAGGVMLGILLAGIILVIGLIGAFAGGASWVAQEVGEIPRKVATKVVRLALEQRVGPIDGVEFIELRKNRKTQEEFFRFEASSEKISSMASRLNFVPMPIYSIADHGLKRGPQDPEWWLPEQELTCCTRYSGLDASGSGVLFLGYNPNNQVAYLTYTVQGTNRSPRR